MARSGDFHRAQRAGAPGTGLVTPPEAGGARLPPQGGTRLAAARGR